MGRLASRFPGWQATEETAADWATKLTPFPADVAWRVVDRMTSTSAGHWPPPLGQIRAGILAELERGLPRALPEPRMSPEAFRAGVRGVLDAIDGKSGPLARALADGLTRGGP